MVELNQNYVIEQVAKFLEKGRNGFDGSFNIKCESGKVKIDLSLSLVLGSQEQSRKDDSDLSSYHQIKTSKRSKKSPSRIRRNWLRAEKYRAKNSTIQTIDKNCVASTTEEVPITEDFPVLNEVETDEDAEDFSKVNVIDCIEDIFEDDSSCKYAIAEDDASDDSEDKEENHLVFIVFCETYVNVLRTGYIGLSVCGYKKEEMCWGSGNNKDRKWRRGEDLEWAPSGSRKKFFAVNSEDRVFKEYYGFAFKEPGGYDADISWIDYDDLNLYSKNVHNNINYDIETGDWIVIVEI